MKKFYIILLGFIPLFAFCQKPVKMNVQSFQTGISTYTFHIEIEIDDGWHAFAITDTALGIEPFTLSIDDQSILIPADCEEASNKTLMNDPLFNGKSFYVFTKKLSVEKIVEVNAHFHSVAISLRGFASNNKKIMPIDIIKEVEIKI